MTLDYSVISLLAYYIVVGAGGGAWAVAAF